MVELTADRGDRGGYRETMTPPSTSAENGGPLALAAPEDTHTQAEWEAATAAVLRKSRTLAEDAADSDVWSALAVDSVAGISIAPLGTQAQLTDLPPTGAPGAAPYTRGRTATRPGWDNRPAFDGTDAAEVNRAILADLENGASSVHLRLYGGVSPAELGELLGGVHLDLAPVSLEAGDQLAAARALADLVAGVRPADGTSLGVDPITARLRGQAEVDTAAAVAEAAELARRTDTLALAVDATVVPDLGGAESVELGYSLAVGAAYLRALEAAGVPVAEALGLIEFRYTATDDQFVTIAKLRAARQCWDRIARLSGAADSGGQRQHVITSRSMLSRFDPYVNMLRVTVAAFAAGVGGADAVTVLPFDAALGLPSAFSRRIARNVSTLLMSESHVGKVSDPAGGAYAVERMTADLAEAAWRQFTEFERAGGIEQAIADGALDRLIQQCVSDRRSRVARRQLPLTGVTEFPNPTEQLPERPPYPDGTPSVLSYGNDFEQLRDEPAAGAVFLATMGPIAAHTARATFATNLFAAGGVAVDAAGPTDGPEALVAAYSGQPVVCLAGTDTAYAEWGAAAVEALREAGARWLVLAGRAGGRTVAADLIDDACALGVDALAFLNRTREQLR